MQLQHGCLVTLSAPLSDRKNQGGLAPGIANAGVTADTPLHDGTTAIEHGAMPLLAGGSKELLASSSRFERDSRSVNADSLVEAASSTTAAAIFHELGAHEARHGHRRHLDINRWVPGFTRHGRLARVEVVCPVAAPCQFSGYCYRLELDIADGQVELIPQLTVYNGAPTQVLHLVSFDYSTLLVDYGALPRYRAPLRAVLAASGRLPPAHAG